MTIKLLSTDFDGTLVEHDGSPPVSPRLFETFAALREAGTIWAVNTGRVLWHIEEGLKEFGFPIEPDYVLTSEREVFYRGPDGKWTDYGDWNKRCLADHDALFLQAGPLLADIRAFLEKEVRAHAIYEGDRMIGLCTETDREMDRVCEFLDRERSRVPGFHYMRNTIYVRFCHEAYSKGTALGELARLLNIPREAIFAVGDHFNDIPMLDGTHAGYVTCPGNAVEPVRQAVARAGGYVAKSCYSLGVVEALEHFGAVPR